MFFVRIEGSFMYNKAELFEDLKALGAPRDKIVIMHSAYSLLGEFEGGPRAFLDALIEYFTAEGGLFCIPTHTWGLLGETDLFLDMTEKYTNLGLLPRLALEDGRGVRSENPTHSIVVFDDKERAEELVECEKWVTTPTSPDGFYGALLSECGYVLLLGVTQTSNTFLHAVDEILGISCRMSDEPLPARVKRSDGSIVEREFYMYNEEGGDVSCLFDKFSLAFDYRGTVKRGKVGGAPAILCDAAAMTDTVELIYSRSGDIDPLGDNIPIPPKWYI
jgi:aminoglycoside N3'-acetyltransferase